MIRICELAVFPAELLACAIYLTAILQLITVVVCKRYINIAFLAVHVFLISELTSGIKDAHIGILLKDVPAAAVMLFIVVSVVFACRDCVRCRRRSMNTLTPSSVKEAADNLPLGLCFADSDGQIILMNHVMTDLTAAFNGQAAQTLEEIDRLFECADSDGIIRISGPAPDGGSDRLWRLRRYGLLPPELDGYMQITAQDVTELHESIRLLELENEHLEETNRSLMEMYELLADRIRQQELLELKIRIHNNIGTSLLEIAELMDANSNSSDGALDDGVSVQSASDQSASDHSASEGRRADEIGNRLSILKDAVSYLVNDNAAMAESDQTRLIGNSRLRLSVRLEGELPDDETLYELVSQAVQECATNCVRHARGNQLTVRLTHGPETLRVEIINNGTPPRQKIIEGGGLSSLRRKLESHGGTMTILHNPIFRLIVELPERSKSDD